jgi:hypothetical protein
MKSVFGYLLLGFGLVCLFKGFMGGFSLWYMIGAGILFAWGLNLILATSREETIAAIKETVADELDVREAVEDDFSDDLYSGPSEDPQPPQNKSKSIEY